MIRYTTAQMSHSNRLHSVWQTDSQTHARSDWWCVYTGAMWSTRHVSHKSKSQIIDSRRKLRPAATVCVCVCVCVRVRVCVCVCVCVMQIVCGLCMCANLCVYVYACTYVCMCMCVMESVYLSVYLYVIEKACACVCPYLENMCTFACARERKNIKLYMLLINYGVSVCLSIILLELCVQIDYWTYIPLRLGAEIWT